MIDKVPDISGGSVRGLEFPIFSEKYDLVGRLLKAGEAPVLHTEEEEEEEERRKYITVEYLEMEFLNNLFVEISGHKLASSQTRVLFSFLPSFFPFYEMLFMKRHKFSCIADFLYVFLKPE